MTAFDDIAPIAIEVISDVVCPWCYVGKRRLEAALADAPMAPTVRWRPFQLDPTIPPEGKPRRDYLMAKFGSEARIRELHESLAAAGATEGIAFAFERIDVSPNTLDAHRLIRWAGDAGMQEGVVEALFRAYFLDGRNIGDQAVLAEIGAAHGLDDRDAIAARLASGEDRGSVSAEVAGAQRMGVSGVPTFILGGRYALVGAQPAGILLQAFRTAAAEAGRQRVGEARS